MTSKTGSTLLTIYIMLLGFYRYKEDCFLERKLEGTSSKAYNQPFSHLKHYSMYATVLMRSTREGSRCAMLVNGTLSRALEIVLPSSNTQQWPIRQ